MSLTRREFLKTSTAISVATAAGSAPAFAQGTRLHYLQWSHFIPAADVVFEEQVDMYARAIQGMPAEDAVKSAAAELKKIY